MTTIISGTTGQEITLPEFGDKLPNGATVISYSHVEDGGRGWLPNGIVLCYTGREFVTWLLACNERGEWHAECGHYYPSIVSAASDYESRGGK